jgi:hypothetical protein
VYGREQICIQNFGGELKDKSALGRTRLNGRQYFSAFEATGRRAWTGLIWHTAGIGARLL